MRSDYPDVVQARRIAVAAVVAVLLLIGAVILLPRLAGPSAVASPSATASPSGSPTASPTASPTGSATATPSPAATATSGRYVNSTLGFSIQLAPPWRRTACLSSAEDARSPETLGSDTFTSVPPAEESYGDTGVFVNTVSVRVERNPSRLTAEEWSRSPRMGQAQGQRTEPATLDGRAGVRIAGGALQTETTIVAVDDLMYMVGFTAATPTDASVAVMRGIVASFAFVPRTAAPAATSRPARSAETVADALADGFARKDATALASLMSNCVLSGVEGGGFGSHSPESFTRILRGQLAAGTTVIVRARPIESAPGYVSTGASYTVATTWTDPGQAPRRVDLIIAADGAFHYWRGTIQRQQPP
jgi:hypothetical protein